MYNLYKVLSYLTIPNIFIVNNVIIFYFRTHPLKLGELYFKTERRHLEKKLAYNVFPL